MGSRVGMGREEEEGARVNGSRRSAWLMTGVLALVSLFPARAGAQPPPAELPLYLRDRGLGIPTSMFGTYVAPKEWVAYVFYEYTVNRDAEYKPAELGFGLDQDFRAKSTEHEFLLFYGFGVSDWFLFELESALFASVEQEKAGDDPSAMPSRIRESGIGDTEGQFRWRLRKETAGGPEIFTYTEVVLPLQRRRKLLGTQDWEFAQGLGFIKGSGFGTFTVRGALAYSTGENKLEAGEYALEYLKRASEQWRWYVGVEGEQDEVALIAEAQFRLSPDSYLKLNDGIGLTDKAPDHALEVGVVMSFH